MGRSTTNRPGPQETPIQAMAEPLMPPSADVTPANFADAQFDRAVADLEQILVEQRDTLDPRTVVVIERNLAVIDEAIRQARAALEIDPANTFLNSHLADARRRKLDLLRRATALSGAGNAGERRFATQVRNAGSQRGFATQVRNAGSQRGFATQVRNAGSQHRFGFATKGS